MKQQLMKEVDYEPLLDHEEYGLTLAEVVPDIGPGIRVMNKSVCNEEQGGTFDGEHAKEHLNTTVGSAPLSSREPSPASADTDDARYDVGAIREVIKASDYQADPMVAALLRVGHHKLPFGRVIAYAGPAAGDLEQDPNGVSADCNRDTVSKDNQNVDPSSVRDELGALLASNFKHEGSEAYA